MYGGKLTSRQYSVFMAMTHDHSELASLEKVAHYKNKIVAKDTIRLSEELLEGYRRKMVLTGQWPEDISHALLKDKLEETRGKFPTKSVQKVADR